jgi:hypothetical protein
MEVRVSDLINVMKRRNPEQRIAMYVDSEDTAVIEIKLVEWKKWQKFIKRERLNFS